MNFIQIKVEEDVEEGNRVENLKEEEKKQRKREEEDNYYYINNINYQYKYNLAYK